MLHMQRAYLYLYIYIYVYVVIYVHIEPHFVSAVCPVSCVKKCWNLTSCSFRIRLKSSSFALHLIIYKSNLCKFLAFKYVQIAKDAVVPLNTHHRQHHHIASMSKQFIPLV
jgi:hypothetical protein